jgi:hypothetical protein
MCSKTRVANHTRVFRNKTLSSSSRSEIWSDTSLLRQRSLFRVVVRFTISENALSNSNSQANRAAIEINSHPLSQKQAVTKSAWIHSIVLFSGQRITSQVRFLSSLLSIRNFWAVCPIRVIIEPSLLWRAREIITYHVQFDSRRCKSHRIGNYSEIVQIQTCRTSDRKLGRTGPFNQVVSAVRRSHMVYRLALLTEPSKNLKLLIPS